MTTPDVHYLEIVTPDVEQTCAMYARLHGWSFDSPRPELGNARVATLSNGSRVGVRAPMHAQENPVTRAYVRVADIERATKLAAEHGATIAVPPMEIAGQGTIAIYFLGGVEHGLWQCDVRPAAGGG